MDNQKYQLLKMRLKAPGKFSSNNDIWKTGNMNKFISVHGAFLCCNEVFVLGKYRDSVDPVRQLIRYYNYENFNGCFFEIESNNDLTEDKD